MRFLFETELRVLLLYLVGMARSQMCFSNMPDVSMVTF